MPAYRTALCVQAPADSSFRVERKLATKGVIGSHGANRKRRTNVPSERHSRHDEGATLTELPR
jgi:hypothetical protein